MSTGPCAGRLLLGCPHRPPGLCPLELPGAFQTAEGQAPTPVTRSLTPALLPDPSKLFEHPLGHRARMCSGCGPDPAPGSRATREGQAANANFISRELNSMGIWYRMGRVPRNHDSSQPTTPSQSSAASTPAPNLPR
ncbi:Multivesicular body subunit 12B [Galemys pyrenaicus]|uniref:Multivesicular body subunit 12B n=1 Tax=Galemys pyrenaicus TaxID=202257 RepID=A0A8J6A5Q1_GALPY|nr:Multivesicular body subunit 12B [Galemys pyrenaicus]